MLAFDASKLLIIGLVAALVLGPLILRRMGRLAGQAIGTLLFRASRP